MEVIDRYELLEELGAGAFGRVYRARHQVLGREVALKVLLDRSERERFLREAAILAQLDHPHIVKVYDSGTTPDGHAFLALELLEGETTAQRLRSTGAQPVAEATWIVDQLLEGLAAAHERGIVHRDLKHPNVFLAQGPSGVTLKILDFGIAKLAGAGRLTSTGMLLGTPRYMAPEVLRGEDADAKADLWAAGLMLYELLLGQPAYTGSPEEAVAAIAHGPPAPLRSRAPNLPPLLYDVVDTALAYEPSGRFATAEAFRAALRSAATARPVDRTTRRSFATGTLDMESFVPTGVVAPQGFGAPRSTASTRQAKRGPVSVPTPAPSNSPAAESLRAPAPAPRSRGLVAGLVAAIVVLLVVAGGALYALFAREPAAVAEAAVPEPVPEAVVPEAAVPEPVPAAPTAIEEDEKPPPHLRHVPAELRPELPPADVRTPQPRSETAAPERAADRSAEILGLFDREERVLRVRSCTALEGDFSPHQVDTIERRLESREIHCPPGEYAVVIHYEDGRSGDVLDPRGRSAPSCLRNDVRRAAWNRFSHVDGAIRCDLY